MKFKKYKFNINFWLNTNKIDRQFINYLSAAIKHSNQLSKVQSTLIRYHILHQYILPGNMTRFKKICDIINLDLIIRGIGKNIEISIGNKRNYLTFHYEDLRIMQNEQETVNGNKLDTIINSELNFANRILIGSGNYTKIEIDTLLSYLRLLINTFQLDSPITPTSQYFKRIIYLEQVGYNIKIGNDKVVVSLGDMNIDMSLPA